MAGDPAGSALRPAFERAELFETLADNLPQLAWIADENGRLQWCNKGWSDYTGLKPEDLTGAKWRELYDPEHVDRIAAAHETAYRAGVPWENTYPLRGKDGSSRWFLTRAQPVKDASGRVLHWIGTCTDIHDLKMAEDALAAKEAQLREEAIQKESDERLRRVLDQLLTFVGVLTLDGRLIEANRAPLAAGGLSADEVLGKKFWETYWWSYSPAIQEQLKAAIQRAALGEPVHYEVPVRVAGDQLITVDFLLSPLRDNAGSITNLIAGGIVIEDRVRAETERRRLIAILEGTPDFVGIADRDGRTTYLNPAARRMVGLGPDQELSGSITEFHPPEMAKLLDEVALSAAARLGSWEGESLISVHGGEPIPVSEVVMAHRDAKGDVEFFSIVARDISDLKAAQERERLLAREVDHRAKNLLAVVQSMVQLSRADDAEQLKKAITGRIQSLGRTHSLLAASRWEGADLMLIVQDELAPYKQADRAALRIDGPSVRLRPAAAQTFALVIHEFSTNSMKYGSLGGEHGVVDISWAVETEAPDRQVLKLCWREAGGPPVEGPRRSGFGTTLVRSSVERQLKGRAEFRWEPEGLVCEIAVPVEEVVADNCSSRLQSHAAASDEADAQAEVSGLNVLVLEDEPLVALQIETALRNAGCGIVGPAARVSEALDLISCRPVEAAILDVNVAEERSFPVADLLRTKGVPFAFCTGYSGSEALPARYHGAVVLRKPIASAQLIAGLGRAVAMSSKKG